MPVANPNVRRIQLSMKKTGVLSKMKNGSLVKMFIPKLVTMLINLVRIGPKVILRSSFQILRTNIWTRLISTFILVFFDFYNFFRKRISRKQLVINLILSVSLLVGGTAGWVLGTNSVLIIVAENTAIWIIAGLAGAGIFGAVFDAICRKVLGRFVKNDLEDMIDMFNNEFESMVAEHALDNEQADEIAGRIHLHEKACLDCFSKGDKKKYVRDILTPYFYNDII